MQKTILAIETSCDETAVSIVQTIKNENKIVKINVLAHVIESQIEIHAPFGGVVPEVAARDHLAKIDDVAKQALKEAQIPIQSLDAIAVTLGPGLIGALMVGVLYARGLAYSLSIPLIGVNHVDAHLAPALILRNFHPSKNCHQWQDVTYPEFPILSLTVSGGHCHLSLLRSINEKQILGKTKDDACGEAFDKIGKLLGLGYPGGPYIEKIAKLASQKNDFVFPTKISDLTNRYDFSYSGLKTSVMEAVRKQTNTTKGKISGANLPLEIKQAIAYSFQEAALEQLLNRVENALHDIQDIKGVFIAGGVAQNMRFRELFSKIKCPLFFAPPSLCSDNATMIALQAHLIEKYDGFIQQPFSRYS